MSSPAANVSARSPSTPTTGAFSQQTTGAAQAAASSATSPKVSAEPGNDDARRLGEHPREALTVTHVGHERDLARRGRASARGAAAPRPRDRRRRSAATTRRAPARSHRAAARRPCRARGCPRRARGAGARRRAPGGTPDAGRGAAGSTARRRSPPTSTSLAPTCSLSSHDRARLAIAAVQQDDVGADRAQRLLEAAQPRRGAPARRAPASRAPAARGRRRRGARCAPGRTAWCS